MSPIVLDPNEEASGPGIDVSDLVDRVRRHMRDFPTFTRLNEDLTDSDTGVSVIDGTFVSANGQVEIDAEVMRVLSVSGNTLTVNRGDWGTAAAVHSTGADVLINPRFTAMEIIDALSDGIQAAWPYVYKRVIDTSLTALENVYEYTVPTVSGDTDQVIPFIWKVETLRSGEYDYVDCRPGVWRIVRGAVPKIKFDIYPEPGATIRLHGYARFPRLESSEDTVDSDWPRNLERPLVEYASAILLASGENYRVGTDRGAIDDREQANKPGASMAASQYELQLYLRRVQLSGFPSMVRHARKVI